MQEKNKRHTEEGSLYTTLIRETFRLYGCFIQSGDRLAGRFGLNSSRWQVLGTLADAPYPLTVASLARNLGLQRQSVQRLVDAMKEKGLVDFEDNPHHRRAKIVVLTEAGRTLFDELAVFQAQWANEISDGLSPEQLKSTISLMQTLQARLKA
ncbi:MAG: MarR family transcriptional regulator [Pigmentiphaga sp.]|nr:MarR family transcriptional regulator [Pigmentiphaga sp.]